MRRWLRLRDGIAISLAVLGLYGCSGAAWEAARGEDTIAAYHRFLRDHPNTRFTKGAKERLEFVRVRTRPSVNAYESFEQQYPESGLLEELRAIVEPHFFDQAREVNTPEGYKRFLDMYPSGQFSARAWGNRTYLEKVDPDPTVARLDEFVSAYPESDFTPLARRTLETLDLHERARMNHIGVRVVVGPGIVHPNRIRRGFTGVVQEAYSHQGVRVTMLGDSEGVSPDIDGWIQVDYNEVPPEGVFSGGSLMSHCRVRLFHRQFSEPVWDRTFKTKADHIQRGAQSEDPTVFGNRKYSFWDEFFVPVSVWPTSRTRYYRQEYSEPVAAVAVEGDRGAVLTQDGNLEYLDLSNALEPLSLGRYRHERDLTRWVGVVLLPGGRVVSYGPDGAEVVDMSDVNAKRLARWERVDVGAVTGAVRSGKTVLLAGDKGLFAVRAMRKPVALHRLTDRPLVAVSARDFTVHLIGKHRALAANSQELVKWAVAGHGASAPALSRVQFPRGFEAQRIHTAGDSIFVMGKSGAVIEVGAQNPEQLVLANKIDPQTSWRTGSRWMRLGGPRPRVASSS
jgi:hypothetical protein